MAATVCIVLRTPQPHARALHDARTHANRMLRARPPSCAVYAISRYVSAAIVSVPRETSSNPGIEQVEGGGNIENAHP